MKHIILNIAIMLMFTFFQTTLFAQSSTFKTDTITVSGNCGQCKERIEDAAYIKGVKHAEWNKTSKVLTVIYNSSKTSIDKVELAVSKAGHDTRDHKASDKSYKQLPECCAYRSGACHHE